MHTLNYLKEEVWLNIFSFIFSFIFVEKIQQSSLQGYISVVLISLQFCFFWLNRYRVFLSTWSRPWTCLCFITYMEDPSPVKSWAGEWNTECLGNIALAWGDIKFDHFSCQSCVHNFHSLSCWAGFISWGRLFLIWEKGCWVVSVIWATCTLIFKPEADIVAIVRNLNLV